MLDCVVFSLVTDTKMQWEEVFGFLFLIVGIVMVFAILHVVEIPSWHW